MESKFYIPKITEFYIGFEYQGLVDYYKDEYETFIVENTSDLIQRMETYDSQCMDFIRVKYLDKEDIESFGFKLFENMPSRFHYNKYELDVDYLNVIRIEYDCNYIFKGRIKNKSELKKLLIQLEIINE